MFRMIACGHSKYKEKYLSVTLDVYLYKGSVHIVLQVIGC